MLCWWGLWGVPSARMGTKLEYPEGRIMWIVALWLWGGTIC